MQFFDFGNSETFHVFEWLHSQPDLVRPLVAEARRGEAEAATSDGDEPHDRGAAQLLVLPLEDLLPWDACDCCGDLIDLGCGFPEPFCDLFAQLMWSAVGHVQMDRVADALLLAFPRESNQAAAKATPPASPAKATPPASPAPEPEPNWRDPGSLTPGQMVDDRSGIFTPDDD